VRGDGRDTPPRSAQDCKVIGETKRDFDFVSSDCRCDMQFKHSITLPSVKLATVSAFQCQITSLSADVRHFRHAFFTFIIALHH
jgi:hypothetical protein